MHSEFTGLSIVQLTQPILFFPPADERLLQRTTIPDHNDGFFEFHNLWSVWQLVSIYATNDVN